MEIKIRGFIPKDQKVCETIVRSLPEWFGIEEAIASYVQDVARMETWIAEVDSVPVGFITIKSHNPLTSEIQVMAILKKFHAKGIGRALVGHVEIILKQRGIAYCEVKTLGPSRPNAHYERTRGFYERIGFIPLEENNLWGDVNPCLIMVKHLQCCRFFACQTPMETLYY